MANLLRSFRAIKNQVYNKIEGKIPVGRDLHGNQYFVVKAQCPSTGRSERRSIIYANGEFSSETIPQAWYRWLYHIRDTPPTMQDLKAETDKNIRFQARVREVELADEKKRIQYKKELELDLGAFVSQVQTQHNHQQTGGEGRAAPKSQPPPPQARPAATATAPPQPSTPAAPVFTSPPAPASSTATSTASTSGAVEPEPVGQGDTFRPAAWKPTAKPKRN